MPSTRRTRRRPPTTLHVTARERDLLLAHGDPAAGFADVFAKARAHGSLVCLELTDEALGDFLDAFEQTANLAQNIEAMDRLAHAFARIVAGLAGETDPGWHRLRPAIGRLDMSPVQGQYLAFIHAYTRLHRRAPAEADIRDYFQTSPPTVHGMLKTLQQKEFISRVPGAARSIRVLLAPHEIPDLE